MKFIFILTLSGLCFSQDKGKKAYDSGNYDEARYYYEHVLKNRKNDSNALFGLGATAYQQQDMETAAKSMNDVMNSKNPELASKALYNLGNMFKDQQKMEESLALYRKALELDPTDEDAKINFEMLKQVMQQQEQKKEQEQNQDKDQNQDSESEQNQQENSEQNQEQNQDQQSDSNSERNDQQEQNNNQSQQESGNEEKSQEQKETKTTKPEEKTDKQVQAEAILNALKDQEKINQKRQIAKAKSRKLEKDW